MLAKVTLKVVAGEMQGQEFVFDERTTCIIGRAKDCSPRVPDNDAHKSISRHHCLLDINPPDVRVRDFGSLHGTFVNGRIIGQRAPDQPSGIGHKVKFPEHDLADGDEIRLEYTIFRVGVYVPARCAQCSCEIPDDEQAQARRGPSVYLCVRCRTQRERPVPGESARKPPRRAGSFSAGVFSAGVPGESARKPPRRCAKCRRDVSGEVAANRHGDVICSACKADPMELLKQLLTLAGGGDKRLASIEGYSILGKLGEGGMGAVYRARHEQSGEEVALKVMLPEVAVEEWARDRFLREIENTRVLRHPNVVRLRDAGFSHGTFFLTLDLCRGGSLAGLAADRGGKLPIREAVPLMLQVLDGLHYAHHVEVPKVKLKDGRYGRGNGLVHRDLKPGNIFLDGARESPVAKVGDYGLSKAFDTAGLSGQTASGASAGTPFFMPRQQVSDFKYAQPEVDVWAAAASLYNLLTGVAPRDFPEGKDPWAIVLGEKPVAIRQRDPSIPRRLAEVIDHALVDDPEIKVKSAAELKRMLESVL